MRLIFPFLPIMGPWGYLAIITKLDFFSLKVRRFGFVNLLLWVGIFLLLSLIYGNPIFLRTAGLFVGICVASIIIREVNRKELTLLVDIFFWTNIVLIFLDYVSFTYGNNFFESSGRFGGLLGYDFVPFILATYIVNVIGRNKSLSYIDMLAISVSIAAMLMSGRFGIVVMGLLFVLIALNKPRATVWVPIMFIVPPVLLLFQNHLSFTFASLELLITNLISGTGDFSELDEFNLGGYYIASPLTWAKEVFSVFRSGNSIWFPNPDFVRVDSGPAFLAANGGVLLVLFYYGATMLLFWPNSWQKRTLLAILFLVDLKFRCLLSAWPSIWLLMLFQVSGQPSEEKSAGV